MQIHEIQGYIQSIYLVEYPDKLMLLDGCCRADHDTVVSFIENTLKRSRFDLSLIVVTHMHPDHAGGALILAKTCQAQISASNAPSQWYRGLDGLLMHWTDMLLAAYVAKRKQKALKPLFYPRKLTPHIYLADNMHLPGFDEWQILHTPGHTDRDIAVYHIPSKKVYVADLIVKVKNKLLAPFPLFYPRRYRHSLRKIQTLAPHSVILAHQGELPFSDIDFDTLINNAPSSPMTHWRSVKLKLKRVVGL